MSSSNKLKKPRTSVEEFCFNRSNDSALLLSRMVFGAFSLIVESWQLDLVRINDISINAMLSAAT